MSGKGPPRVVDCHVHVFDPQRFPYRPDTFYARPGRSWAHRLACARCRAGAVRTRAELADLRAAGVVGVTLNAALLGVGYYADADRLLVDLAALDMIADVQVVDDQVWDTPAREFDFAPSRAQ